MPAGERAGAIARLANVRGFEIPTVASAEHFYQWLRNRRQSAEPVIDRICLELGIDIAGFLEKVEPHLTSDQVEEMQTEGFVFGAHSRHHAKLGTLPPDEQAAEIVESCRIVAEITRKHSVPFAFPFSGAGVERAMLRELRAANPVVGPIFDTQKLKREPGVQHRIWADKPVPGVQPGDNLKYWLLDAYRVLLADGRLQA
jgi:hypothetical protein